MGLHTHTKGVVGPHTHTYTHKGARWGYTHTYVHTGVVVAYFIVEEELWQHEQEAKGVHSIHQRVDDPGVPTVTLH